MRLVVVLITALLPIMTILSCATARAAGEKSTRMVLVDGESMLAEEHAQRLLEQSKAADRSSQKKLLRRVVDEYADTSVRGPAAVALSRLLLDEADAGSHAEAMRALEALLRDDPNNLAADDARLLLPIARLKGGGTDDASIEAALKDVPDANKAAAMEKLAQDMAAQNGLSSLRLLAKARTRAVNQQERKRIEEAIATRLDDGTISFTDIETLHKTDARGDAFLDELVSWKLAKVQLHLRNPAQASSLAQDVIKRFPSGRFAADANQLVTRLKARVEVRTNVVGVLLPLTGEYASYGKRSLAAIQLAFGISVRRPRAANEDTVLDPNTGEATAAPAAPDKLTGRYDGQGGLVLVVRDSGGRADSAISQVRNLVEEEHVMAILGDLLMDTAVPIAMTAEEYGVPMISLSRKSGVPESGPFSFRLALTPKKQARAIARVAVDGMDIKRFAIMHPRSPFGIEVMNELWDELDARQVEVTAVESYGLDQTTFTNEARALAARGKGGGSSPGCRADAGGIDNDYRRKKAMEECNSAARPLIDWEALIIPDGFRAVSYLVPALVAEDVLMTNSRGAMDDYRRTTGSGAHPVQLFGTNTWNDPELAKRVGSQIRGALFVDAFDANNGSTPMAKAFLTEFQAAVGSKPQLTEAQAYDGARILQTLLSGTAADAKAAAAPNAPKPTSRDALRQQLDALTDFPGVTGVLSFDEAGDSQASPLFFRVQDGSLERTPMSQLLKAQG